jgi:hypothetical protein
VILCDANLLLYAYNRDALENARAVRWLENSLSGGETVAFCWPVISAFLRISTNLRTFTKPLSMSEAIGHVDEWLARKNSAVVGPTSEHWLIFSKLLSDAGVRGPMTTDAEIATYAIEHGAVLHTADHGFARFRAVKTFHPLKP